MARSTRYPSSVRSKRIFKISDLKKCGRFRPINLREEDGTLVSALTFSAEGNVGGNALALFASDDALYAALSGGKVRELSSNRELSLGGRAFGAVTFCDRAGVRRDFLFGEFGVKCFDVAGGTLSGIPFAAKPRCGAIFRERLFLAEGSKLFYSAPLTPDKFDTLFEGSGEIPLSTVGGDILALIPYGDRLVLFRTYEILILRADANDYDFSFERVKFDGGRIGEGSVQSCGRYLLFQTELGLCRMEGKRCKKVEFSDEEISLSHPAVTASNGGWYFSRATLDGTDCLLIYDPEREDYFLSAAYPAMLAGCEGGLWMNIDGLLMRANRGSGSGVLDLHILHCSFDRVASADKLLEGVTVAGSGSFSVGVSGKFFPEKEYAAEANEKFLLRHTLPAEGLTLSIQPKGTAFGIRSVTLHLREVGA